MPYGVFRRGGSSVQTQTIATKSSVGTQTTATQATARTDIPFADLAIEGKLSVMTQTTASETPTLAKLKLILTDDNLYFDALSVLESHVYLPALLQKKGWSFQRMYSRNWWDLSK